MPKPRKKSAGPRSSDAAAAPRLGGWGIGVLLFGFLGGLVGWLTLKNRDPARARHVLKWGLVCSVISIILWLVAIGVTAALFLRTAASSAAFAPSVATDTSSSVYLSVYFHLGPEGNRVSAASETEIPLLPPDQGDNT